MAPLYHTNIPHASGIYKIVCKSTSKIYIGSTNDLRKRYQAHFGELRRSEHANQKLQYAFNKYGESCFTFEVLEFVLAPFLIEREQHWLDKLQPFDKQGFNIDRIAGGTRLGYKFSPESREKMRQSHVGQVSPNKGKKANPEAIAKMRAAKLGKPTAIQYTPELRAKMSASQSGHEVKPETREKLRNANIGNKHTPEARAKIAEAGRGREFTPERRQKISNAMQGNANYAKDYIVTSPEGVEYTVHNLTEFCQEHHLTQQALSSVASGKRKHHKGWIARYPDTNVS